jgi:hypothetical protein|eukprot:COSAG01_NODE_3583_length_5909_cov_37.019618_2_plen_199_part_00
MFMNANRERVKAANPQLSVTQLSQLLGQQWRELTEDARQPYIAQAAADKRRYEQELQTWKEQHPEQVTAMAAQAKVTRKAKRTKKGKAEGPKRGTSAYLYFCSAVRAETKAANPDLKMTELSKILGQKWKSLDASEKSKYEKMAVQDKARYEREKSAIGAQAGGLKKSASPRPSTVDQADGDDSDEDMVLSDDSGDSE